MKRIAASLLIIGATASPYKNNTNIQFDPTLDCTSCIRSGNDFCLYTSAEVTTTATSWSCNSHSTDPEAQVKNGTVTPNAYMCSNYMDDQINAIVNGCRPYLSQNRDINCGEYLVDLSLGTYFPIGRTIMHLAKNTSCTYRAYSTCGYPSVQVGTQNEAIKGDFDIAFAAYNGINRDEDINGWDNKLTADWAGSFNSDEHDYGFAVSQTSDQSLPKISDSQFVGCNSTARSLYVTVTRTKVGGKLNPTSEDFLAATPRQLQGQLTYDYQMRFENIQGPTSAGRFLSVVTLAFAALVAVFAF